jgi:hypothetical protein
MIVRKAWWYRGLLATLTCSCIVTAAAGQTWNGARFSLAGDERTSRPSQADQSRGPNDLPLQVAGRSDVEQLRAGIVAAQPNEHPLMPVLRWAKEGLRQVEQIQDYTAIMVKRERIDGKLNEPDYTFIKVRQRPFSVYMTFLKPEAMKGQEVIFIPGMNNGKMLAHGTGIKKMFGTVSLDPTGPIAMKGNRYPITEVGISNMVARLIEQGEKDAKYGECDVKFFPGAKINNRVCTCVQVMHPVPRRNFLFHLARIFVDDELNVPIRFESYEWPTQPGGPPEMTEEYTYVNLKLNVGLTDADFDTHNPAYGFKDANKSREVSASAPASGRASR